MEEYKIKKKHKNCIKDKVLILLSSYNGEKYICQQLDSLLNQTYPVFILIRDDGSTDETMNILRGYETKFSNIKVIEGENVGFVNSFNWLISSEIVDEYEWIAFCDQDDIWLPKKIERAVKALKVKGNKAVPSMYCSNLQVVDEKLHYLGVMHKSYQKIKKTTIYVQNIASGCTIVFNQAALHAYRFGLQKGITMVAHDYTMYCICYFLGEVVYDFKTYILYRQHGNNVCGTKGKPFIQGCRDVIADLLQPKREKRKDAFQEFISVYNRDLSRRDVAFLHRFTKYKDSLYNRLNLVFNPTIVGYDFRTTMAFKIRALLGRMY